MKQSLRQPINWNCVADHVARAIRQNTSIKDVNAAMREAGTTADERREALKEIKASRAWHARLIQVRPRGKSSAGGCAS